MDDIGGKSVYASSHQNNPVIIELDPDWASASVDNGTRNILHELGHLIDYRTRNLANGVKNVAINPGSDDRLLLPPKGDVAPNRGLGGTDLIEALADYFYFWTAPDIGIPSSIPVAYIFANGGTFTVEGYNYDTQHYCAKSWLCGMEQSCT